MNDRDPSRHHLSLSLGDTKKYPDSRPGQGEPCPLFPCPSPVSTVHEISLESRLSMPPFQPPCRTSVQSGVGCHKPRLGNTVPLLAPFPLLLLGGCGWLVWGEHGLASFFAMIFPSRQAEVVVSFVGSSAPSPSSPSSSLRQTIHTFFEEFAPYFFATLFIPSLYCISRRRRREGWWFASSCDLALDNERTHATLLNTVPDG